MFTKIVISLFVAATAAAATSDFQNCLNQIDNVSQFIQLEDVVYYREQDAPCLKSFQTGLRIVDPCPPHVVCLSLNGYEASNSATSPQESCFLWKGNMFCN